jgi:hypothetical protein
MGSYLSIVNDTNSVWFVRLPSTTTDKITSTLVQNSFISGESIAELAASAAVLGETQEEIQRLVEEMFLKNGFTRLEPGQSMNSQKLTLSLVQTCECFRLVNDDNIFLNLESLTMRTLFSGATNESTNEYTISSFYNKEGTNVECTIAL